MTADSTDRKSFKRLLEIIEILRGPEGCPWDKEQTHFSLSPFAIEEVYEMVETIERRDDPAFREELGDVLFQVVLHAQLAKERQAFDIEQILQTLIEKMIRRHPHVFGKEKAQTSTEVLKQWEEIKSKEKSENSGDLNKTTRFDIPIQLPALQRAYKIGNKAKKHDFDWENAASVRLKVVEELSEVDEAIVLQQKEFIQEELGDLLFATAQFARHLGFEPETCLRLANNKFENRFFKMLSLCRERNWIFENLSSDQKESLWKEVKASSKSNKTPETV